MLVVSEECNFRNCFLSIEHLGSAFKEKFASTAALIAGSRKEFVLLKADVFDNLNTPLTPENVRDAHGNVNISVEFACVDDPANCFHFFLKDQIGNRKFNIVFKKKRKNAFVKISAADFENFISN